jgi:hypothetical protein
MPKDGTSCCKWKGRTMSICLQHPLHVYALYYVFFTSWWDCSFVHSLHIVASSMSFTNHSWHSMYIDLGHPLTPWRKKHCGLLINTSSTNSTLGKIHDSVEMQQYAHGLTWYMYGAYVTIEFVKRCSCMPSISRINKLKKISLPIKTFLTSTSSSFTSQIWHIVCGYNAKYFVQHRFKSIFYDNLSEIHATTIFPFIYIIKVWNFQICCKKVCMG